MRSDDREPRQRGSLGRFLAAVTAALIAGRDRGEGRAPEGGAGAGGAPPPHEPATLRANAVALAGALLLLGIAAVMLATGGYLRAVPEPEGPVAVTLSADEIATLKGAREWARPSELAALRQSERRHLDGYGWVDRPAGVVRIPVDRAMALIASGRADMPGTRRVAEAGDAATSRPGAGTGRIR